jgi:hypothetical protein
MTDEETKTIDSYIKNNSPSSTYAKRRTISSDEIVDVMIKHAGFDDGNLILLTDVAGDDYVLEFNKDDNLSKDELYNLIVDKEYDNSLHGKNIQVSFNDKMTRFGFKVQDYYPYRCSIVDESEKLDIKDDITKDIDSFVKEMFYQRNSDEYHRWDLEISDTKEISDDNFEVITYIDGYSEIKWDLEVPVTTEQKESETAKLIERQGGGLPNQLSDGGQIVVIHENDIDRNLDYVSINDDGWVLCVPESFDEWIETDHSKNSTHSDTNTTSKVSISGSKSSSNIGKTFIHIIPLLLAKPIFETIVPATMKNTEIFDTMMSIVDLMIFISMIILPIAIALEMMKR